MNFKITSRVAVAICSTALTIFSPVMVNAEPSQEVASVAIESGASIPEIDETDQIWMSDYTVTSPTGVLYFDEKKARLDGLSEQKLKKLRFMNGIAATFSPVSDRSWGDVGEFPFEGYRYCGRGNFGWDVPPLNTLDSLCRDHDYCYDTRGYNNCICDQEFITAIAKNKDRMGSLEKKQALGAQAYFLYRIYRNLCVV